MSYVTRFAPSPSGLLHLGHAYSALIAAERAKAKNGAFLLRIEDIDRARSKPAYEQQIYDDLSWLGLSWPTPVMRQSERLQVYQAALKRLINMGLCYPCSCTRSDIRAAMAAPQEGAPLHGPDGMIYPGTCRARTISDASPTDSIRLNMRAALDQIEKSPSFRDSGPDFEGTHSKTKHELLAEIGDIVLARKDMGTSYHLSVVIDDAAQNITEIVRGIDLFDATFIHILLQDLLELPRPSYFHHSLIRDSSGKRLAKRDDAKSIATYRDSGTSVADLKALINLS